jgi:hypothetical protein
MLLLHKLKMMNKFLNPLLHHLLILLQIHPHQLQLLLQLIYFQVAWLM